MMRTNNDLVTSPSPLSYVKYTVKPRGSVLMSCHDNVEDNIVNCSNTFQYFTSLIREQLYYNHGHKEVVTSIYFVKIKTVVLQNPLDSKPGQHVHLRSSALCNT